MDQTCLDAPDNAAPEDGRVLGRRARRHRGQRSAGRRPFAVLAAVAVSLAVLAVGGPGSSAAGAATSRTGLLVFNPHPFPQLGNYTWLSGGLSEPLTTVATLPDAATLDGLSLVYVPVQTEALSAADEAALAGFVTAGGTLVTESEYQGWILDSGLGAQNHLLDTLGVGIDAVPGTWDCGWNTATDIIPDPLTVGVAKIGFGCAGDLSVSGSGRILARGPSGHALVAVDALGSGLVAAVSDSNIWADPVVPAAGDNLQLAANLAHPETTSCLGTTDVGLDADAAAGTVIPGENTTVTVTLTNRGTCPVWGTQVSLDGTGVLVGHLNLVSALPSSGAYDTPGRLWRNALLPVGGTATLTVLVGPDAVAPLGSAGLRATVGLAGYPADPDTTDADVVAGFDVVAPAPGGIDGTVTSSGAPAVGVHVVLYRLSPLWSTVGHAVTDEAGHYAFTNLTPGSYRLRFRDFRGRYADGWYQGLGRSYTQQSAASVGVRPGLSTTQDLDLLARPAGAVDGRVTDPSGGGLGKVWVQVQLIPNRPPCGCALDGYTGLVAGTLTRADGTYHVGGLEPGTYWLRFVDLTGTYRPFWHAGSLDGTSPPTTTVTVDGVTPARPLDAFLI